jgi:hypothetical protein
MRKAVLKSITFKSLVLFYALAGFSAGIGYGLYSLIMSIVTGQMQAVLLGMQFEGIGAGLANLALAPILGLLAGVVLSALGYFPFTGILKAMSGLRFTAEFDFLDEDDT